MVVSMGLLGNGFEDPRSSAIMALAGGLLKGDFGGGLLPHGAGDVLQPLRRHDQRLRAAASAWAGATADLTPDLEKVYTFMPRLNERREQRGWSLSGGEQQMLAIGRALVTNPKLMILDEATEGLAPLIREEIWCCLDRLREAGQTILVVDKYVRRLIRLADRHSILERGRVVWAGDSAALDADHGLWQRYLGV